MPRHCDTAGNIGMYDCMYVCLIVFITYQCHAGPVWGEPDLEVYACEQEQAARSKTEIETTTALVVMHTQSDTEIIADTCHFNSPLTMHVSRAGSQK